MHENPLRRGLVAAPEEWHWSSFRAYAYQEPGPCWSMSNSLSD
jgi:hypothetical protein